jgi:uncharacterized protein (DUF2235 family)
MKRIVVCFDGTWNAADSENSETNVARISRSIRATSGSDGVQQTVLYLRGVGSTGNFFEKAIQGATGAGTVENIRSAYMFIAQNYLPERVDATTGRTVAADEIYLFGFSRGAFAARSLAGFIASVGLLERSHLSNVLLAWNYYRTQRRRSPDAFIKKNADLRIKTHENVKIDFLGVWDTVGALGIPGGLAGQYFGEDLSFHDTTPSRIVRHAAHALAVDEQRDPFVPTFWTGGAPSGATIEQVWFPGCHSDIGGGYEDRALADIPLVWMAERAESRGLQLDWSVLPDKTTLNPFAPLHDSRTLLYGFDRMTPTIRRVCEVDVEVALYETLYAPIHSRTLTPLPTINEAVHESVLRRFGKHGHMSLGGKRSKSKMEIYQPRNIEVLFRNDGSLMPHIKVVPMPK